MPLSDNIQRMIRARMTHETRPDGGRVPARYIRELRGQVSTLSFRWDCWYKCWNVVCHPRNRMPYIVFQVEGIGGSYRPVGDDTLMQVRKSIWWSIGGIARHARDMLNESVYAKQRIEDGINDKNGQFAKDITYPVMDELRGYKGGYGSHNVFNFSGGK